MTPSTPVSLETMRDTLPSNPAAAAVPRSSLAHRPAGAADIVLHSGQRKERVPAIQRCQQHLQSVKPPLARRLSGQQQRKCAHSPKPAWTQRCSDPPCCELDAYLIRSPLFSPVPLSPFKKDVLEKLVPAFQR